MIEQFIKDRYCQEYGRFYAYVRSHGGTREDAEDAFQEGVYWTLRAEKNGKVLLSPGSYLFVAAKNAFVNKKKSPQQWVSYSPETDSDSSAQPDSESAGVGASQKTSTVLDVQDPLPLPDELTHLRFSKHHVEACINALQPTYKKILTLTLEGYQDKKIAEMLDLEPKYIKVARHEARRQLKERLKHFGYAFTIALFILLTL